MANIIILILCNRFYQASHVYHIWQDIPVVVERSILQD